MVAGWSKKLVVQFRMHSAGDRFDRGFHVFLVQVADYFAFDKFDWNGVAAAQLVDVQSGCLSLKFGHFTWLEGKKVFLNRRRESAVALDAQVSSWRRRKVEHFVGFILKLLCFFTFGGA